VKINRKGWYILSLQIPDYTQKRIDLRAFCQQTAELNELCNYEMVLTFTEILKRTKSTAVSHRELRVGNVNIL
jgi:hypothetical protein